jgi:hypothetical protein
MLYTSMLEAVTVRYGMSTQSEVAGSLNPAIFFDLISCFSLN